MQALCRESDIASFSFHRDPVLIIENFWTDEERKYFQQAMAKASWRALVEMPAVRRAFPNCGNWLKADIGREEAATFLNKLTLPCVTEYIESFPHIKGRHMSSNYYSYAAGDCLLTHDDTVQEYGTAQAAGDSPPLRRLALVTYLHDEWHPDWGGELIIYSRKRAAKHRTGAAGNELVISHCIAPRPGTLVLFTVPRYHRVCRVDPVIGSRKRLSIAGWFMTDHYNW